ncbi:MAG: hypothetical protein P3X24_007285, partial [bacterium]|nr:hypothetical protein [bacterium]
RSVMPKRIPRETYDVLIRALRFGHSRESSCAIAGISRSAFYARLRAEERFREKVEQAEALGISAAETCVLEAIRGGDAKSAKWWLERRCRQVYGAKAEVHEDDGYTIEIVAPPDDGETPYRVELMEHKP